MAKVQIVHIDGKTTFIKEVKSIVWDESTRIKTDKGTHIIRLADHKKMKVTATTL